MKFLSSLKEINQQFLSFRLSKRESSCSDTTIDSWCDFNQLKNQPLEIQVVIDSLETAQVLSRLLKTYPMVKVQNLSVHFWDKTLQDEEKLKICEVLSEISVTNFVIYDFPRFYCTSMMPNTVHMFERFENIQELDLNLPFFPSYTLFNHIKIRYPQNLKRLKITNLKQSIEDPEKILNLPESIEFLTFQLCKIADMPTFFEHLSQIKIGTLQFDFLQNQFIPFQIILPYLMKLNVQDVFPNRIYIEDTLEQPLDITSLENNYKLIPIANIEFATQIQFWKVKNADVLRILYILFSKLEYARVILPDINISFNQALLNDYQKGSRIKNLAIENTFKQVSISGMVKFYECLGESFPNLVSLELCEFTDEQQKSEDFQIKEGLFKSLKTITFNKPDGCHLPVFVQIIKSLPRLTSMCVRAHLLHQHEINCLVKALNPLMIQKIRLIRDKIIQHWSKVSVDVEQNQTYLETLSNFQQLRHLEDSYRINKCENALEYFTKGLKYMKQLETLKITFTLDDNADYEPDYLPPNVFDFINSHLPRLKVFETNLNLPVSEMITSLKSRRRPLNINKKTQGIEFKEYERIKQEIPQHSIRLGYVIPKDDELINRNYLNKLANYELLFEN